MDRLKKYWKKVIALNQNSFQKNSFMNINNAQVNQNSGKLGRRTVEEIKTEMNDLKYQDLIKRQNARKTEIVQSNDFNHVPNFKNKVDNLRNINRG